MLLFTNTEYTTTSITKSIVLKGSLGKSSHRDNSSAVHYGTSKSGVFALLKLCHAFIYFQIKLLLKLLRILSSINTYKRDLIFPQQTLLTMASGPYSARKNALSSLSSPSLPHTRTRRQCPSEAVMFAVAVIPRVRERLYGWHRPYLPHKNTSGMCLFCLSSCHGDSSMVTVW